MTWNYRLIKTKDGFFGLHEVYYDSKGVIKAWADEPDVVGENREEILSQLEMMKKDCAKTKILSLENLLKKLGRRMKRRP